MKTVTFQSQQFSIPSWAKYITQDVDGWHVWEDMPVFDYEEHCYMREVGLLRMQSVYAVNGGEHSIMKIKD